MNLTRALVNLCSAVGFCQLSCDLFMLEGMRTQGGPEFSFDFDWFPLSAQHLAIPSFRLCRSVVYVNVSSSFVHSTLRFPDILQSVLQGIHQVWPN
jgi:hypothetical protein